MKISELRPKIEAYLVSDFGVDTWYLEPPENPQDTGGFLEPLRDLTVTQDDGDGWVFQAVQGIQLALRYESTNYKNLPVGISEGLLATGAAKLISFYGGLGFKVSIVSLEAPIRVAELNQDGYLITLTWDVRISGPFEPETDLRDWVIQRINILSIYRRSLVGNRDSLVKRLSRNANI
jgi:hypothetical protein